MNQNSNDSKFSLPEEFTISELRNGLTEVLKDIRTKLFLIIIVSIVCAVLGFIYSLIKKPIYTASATFVLEEGGKSGVLSQYAGLASLAGIDVSSGSNIFSGDNIMELYKSRLMLANSLLSPAIFDGKKELFIERYITYNNLRKKWAEKDNIKDISFTGDPLKFNRQQDSLVSDIVETFRNKLLNIFKIDKKLNIIAVQIASEDELFAKEFVNSLVQNVNNFYIETKTKKSLQNVMILQHQADSVKDKLNHSINSVATALDATPNANPQIFSTRTPSQRRSIDVQANSAIYSEIVKNLEISRISLRQETPLIQIIDKPVLPLPVSKVGKIKGTVAGLFFGAFVSIAFVALRRLFKAL